MKYFSFLNNPSIPKTKVLAAVVILTLVLLTAGLPSLEFKPGQEISPQEQTHTFFQFTKKMDLTWIASLCLSGMFAMFPAAIILLIFSSEARRLFIKYSKGLAVWLAFLLGLRLYILLSGKDQIILESGGNQYSLPDVLDPPAAISVDPGVTEIYTPPDVMSVQSLVIGVIIFVLIGVVVYVLLEKGRSKNEDLGGIALKTLREISGGRQWDDAVIQCYALMNQVISDRQQLFRDESMTPGEFSLRLVKVGLPIGPVRKLTTLFERARYDDRSSHTSETEDAILCLEAIIQTLEGIE